MKTQTGSDCFFNGSRQLFSSNSLGTEVSLREDWVRIANSNRRLSSFTGFHGDRPDREQILPCLVPAYMWMWILVTMGNVLSRRGMTDQAIASWDQLQNIPAQCPLSQ